MNTTLSNHADQPFNRTRSGTTITNEQQRELLSKLLPGKWVAVSEREDLLIMDYLEPNGWRFDYQLGSIFPKYRLIWRQRHIAQRLLNRLTKGEV